MSETRYHSFPYNKTNTFLGPPFLSHTGNSIGSKSYKCMGARDFFRKITIQPIHAISIFIIFSYH